MATVAGVASETFCRIQPLILAVSAGFRVLSALPLVLCRHPAAIPHAMALPAPSPLQAVVASPKPPVVNIDGEPD